MRKRPADDHDTAWKEIGRRYFRLLLEFFFPVVYLQIDWDREIEFLDKELRQAVRLAGKGGRAVDMLVKVWRQDGEQACVLTHLEIQSQVDRTLPERMYLYRSLLQARERLKVESLCILADPDPDWRVDGYEDSVFISTLSLKFGTVKLLDYRDKWEELQRSKNLFALVVMAHLKSLETRRTPGERLHWKLSLMTLMHERGYTEDEIEDLTRYLDLQMPLPESMQFKYEREVTKYEEEHTMPVVTQWERHATERGIKQGLEQGLEQGLTQGLERGTVQASREMVLDALEEHFPDAPLALRDRIAKLTDVDLLRKLLRVIMRAHSIGDIEQHFQ